MNHTSLTVINFHPHIILGEQMHVGGDGGVGSDGGVGGGRGQFK
jgi:hypothetical protein